MRALGRLIWVLLMALIVVVLAIFAVDNITAITVSFVGIRFAASLWWVIIGCAALGFILGLLLAGPGLIARGWRARVALRERERSQSELVTLRERHAALQAERDTLQAERDHLRTRVAQAARTSTPTGTTVRGQETQPQQTAVLPNVGAGQPFVQTPANGGMVTRETVTQQTTTDPRPSAVTDHLRGFFHRTTPTATPTATPTNGSSQTTTSETETQEREPSTPGV